jgi:hypothetical protein
VPGERQMTAKPISIKGAGGKSGGYAWKAIKLTSGDLPLVVQTRLRMERSILTVREKSAKGKVLTRVRKARTALRKEGKGSGE